MARSGMILACLICSAGPMIFGTGCRMSSGLDPSGERIFAAPPGQTLGAPGAPGVPAAPGAPGVSDDCRRPRYADEPGAPPYWADTAVLLRPQTVVAPIGSEVILVAGVKGRDNCLRTNRRLEWALAAGSVGSFIEASSGGFLDYVAGDFTKRRKVDNNYIIGSTTRNGVRLHRGTPATDDDVYVQPGEGWVSLTSPLEGASFVSVYAPDVYPWSARVQSAVVHWIDCQWRCPPPAVRPSGSKHTLTTSVIRGRDQSPCVGWRVRYEIVGGPAAGFDPDGGSSVEVTTDSAGMAHADIFQKQLGPGLNTINIYVIRPGELPGNGGRPLVMRAGATSVQWTAAAATISMQGPATAGIGSTLTYTITVNNSGDQSAGDAVVSQNLPEGVAFVASVPPAEASGRRLSWRLGPLRPGETRTIEASYRVDRVGTLTLCSELAIGRTLSASDCATTTVGRADVELRVAGPGQLRVGDQAVYELVVVNRTGAPLPGLTLYVRYDDGFEHAIRSPIRKRLTQTLGPNESTGPIEVAFRAVKAGQWCHTVEVRNAQDQVLATQRVCASVGDSAPGTAGTGAGGEQPGAQRPELSVSKRGPEEASVGKMVIFDIDIVNVGTRTLTNIQVFDRYDPSLELIQASGGHRRDSTGLSWVIPSLRPGEHRQLSVECRCLRPAAEACNRVEVASQEGASGTAQACLVIREAAGPPAGLFPETRPSAPPSGGAAGVPPAEGSPAASTKLSVRIRPPAAPLTSGKDAVCYVDVTNAATQIDRWISVEAELGEGLTVNPLGTRGPGVSKARVAGKKVSFDKLPELKPGETATFAVRLRAGAVGPSMIRVRASSQEQVRPVDAELPLQVAGP